MIFNMNGVNYDTMRTDEEIKAVIGDVPKVAIGSYTGNNTYRGTNATTTNTLTFDFDPKIVIVAAESTSGDGGPLVMMQGSGMAYNTAGGVNGINLVTWGDKSVSWYSSSNAKMQMNASANYLYTAIG